MGSSFKQTDYIGYGVINSLEEDNLQKTIDTDHTNFLSIIKKDALKSYERNILSNVGPLRGYVLRVENTNGAVIAGSWWSTFFNSTSNVASKDVVAVKVRIPELHAILPIPARIAGHANPDNFIIDMYPTFIAKELNLPTPSPGEIVWVDFLDRKNFLDPIYIGPLNTGNASLTFGSDEVIGTESFEEDEETQSGQLGMSNKFKSVESETILSEPERYAENRIRVGSFGILESTNSLAVKTQTGGNQLLHELAAIRFDMMNREWTAETGNKPFIIGSGLRTHRWNNDFDFYTEAMIKEYGSLKEGRKMKAFKSPHETGLAFDIENNGLTPNQKRFSIEEQKQSQAFNWLKDNAHRFGISPYTVEPWHWEVLITRQAWSTGQDFIQNNNYAVRLTEKSNITDLNTTNSIFVNKGFA